MKLQKLPDRSPVRITFAATPDQNAALLDYAAFYALTYGEAASVADLVPSMLDALMSSDREFAKFRKAKAEGVGGGA